METNSGKVQALRNEVKYADATAENILKAFLSILWPQPTYEQLLLSLCAFQSKSHASVSQLPHN